MSEFELIQVMDMQLSRLSSASMNFITLLFAYAAASFLVGKNLSRLIAIALTFIYSLAAIGPLFGVLVAVRGISTTVQQIHSDYPDGLLSGNMNLAFNVPMATIAMLPLLLGWTISVIYLHAYVRRRVARSPEEEQSMSIGRTP